MLFRSLSSRKAPELKGSERRAARTASIDICGVRALKTSVIVVSAWRNALRFASGKYWIALIVAEASPRYVAFVHWALDEAYRSSAEARYMIVPRGAATGHTSGALAM